MVSSPSASSSPSKNSHHICAEVGHSLSAATLCSRSVRRCGGVDPCALRYSVSNPSTETRRLPPAIPAPAPTPPPFDAAAAGVLFAVYGVLAADGCPGIGVPPTPGANVTCGAAGTAGGCGGTDAPGGCAHDAAASVASALSAAAWRRAGVLRTLTRSFIRSTRCGWEGDEETGRETASDGGDEGR
eukprot:31510-Pelagococcus_subviridis.AAC.10